MATDLPAHHDERRGSGDQLRARPGTFYFHLYGLTRENAAYILAIFPVVRRSAQIAVGHYRTKP